MNLKASILDDAVSATVDGLMGSAAIEEKMNALEALKYIDYHWYKEVVGKRSRWMDLIDDYAGNERFILDGNGISVCLWKI
jgi:hypothetical protein